MIKFSKKELKEYFYIIISGIIINLLAFLICSSSVKAASTNSGELPIYTYDTQGYFTLSSGYGIEFTTVCEKGFTLVKNNFNLNADTPYLVFLSDCNYNTYSNKWVCNLIYCYNPTITQNFTDGFNYLTNSVTINGTFYFCRVDFTYGQPNSIARNGDIRRESYTSGSFYGSQATTSTYTANVSGQGSKTIKYVPKFAYELFNATQIKNTSDVVVISNTVIPVVVPGSATAPSNFNSPVYTQGHSYPQNVPPNITVNNYSWTTYNSPSIDTSTVESLLESLIYVINYLSGWLSSNLSGEFNNLISNLQNLINYIGQTIQYYGDLIISNIQNLITTLYNNLVSLFEPIANNIAYIIQPVSGTVIYDNISSTSLVTNISTINTSLNTFIGSFNDLSEPNSFTIPIHLENLPSSYFGNLSTQYIDVGVIDPVKNIIRIFMWAILTYSLVITIFDSISNYINGGGDES